MSDAKEQSYISWLAIPGGLGANGKLRFGVVVVPTLVPARDGGTLGNEADDTVAGAFKDWPGFVKANLHGFTLQVQGGAKTLTCPIPASARAALDSALWRCNNMFTSGLKLVPLDGQTTRPAVAAAAVRPATPARVHASHSSYAAAEGLLALKCGVHRISAASFKARQSPGKAKAALAAAMSPTPAAAKGSTASVLFPPTKKDLYDRKYTYYSLGRAGAAPDNKSLSAAAVSATARDDAGLAARIAISAMGQTYQPSRSALRPEKKVEAGAAALGLTRFVSPGGASALTSEAKYMLDRLGAEAPGGLAAATALALVPAPPVNDSEKILLLPAAALMAEAVQGVLRTINTTMSAIAAMAEGDRESVMTRLGQVANHPRLMHVVGLAFDLEFDPSEVGLDKFDKGEVVVCVEPVWMGDAGKRFSVDDKRGKPWTYAVWAPGSALSHFRPMPSGYYQTKRGFTATGVINLRVGRAPINGRDECLAAGSDISFHLRTFDLMGLTKKTSGMAQAIADTSEGRSDIATGEDEDARPTTVRTVGITLYMQNRAAADADDDKRISKARDQYTSGKVQPELYQENLVLGYRFDLRDNTLAKRSDDLTTGWLSLCSPVPGFNPPKGCGSTTDPGTQEDIIRLPPHTTAQDPNAPIPAVAEEGLTTWRGAYLGNDPAYRDLDPGNDGQALQKNLDSLDAPLRCFGRQYYLGARVVYLDGSGPTLKEAATPEGYGQCALGDSRCGNQPLPFKRWESINPPDVHLFASERHPNPGEQHIDRIVVRSDRRHRGVFHGKGSLFRCLVPARVPATFADMHGVRLQPGQGGALENRGVVLNDDGSLPKAGKQGGGSNLDHLNTVVCYAPEHAKPPNMPYLPDPMAKGIRIRAGRKPMKSLQSFEPLLDEDGDEVVIDVDFYQEYGSWPNLYPLVIEVRPVARKDGKRTFSWDLSKGSIFSSIPSGWSHLKIDISEADQITLLVSSRIDPLDLNLLALADELLRDDLLKTDGIDPDLLRQIAREGGHYALTPIHEMTVVHKADAPLVRPAMNRVVVGEERKYNNAYQDIELEFGFDRTSCGKIECDALWMEWHDEEAIPAPKQRKVPVSLFGLDLDFFFRADKKRSAAQNPDVLLESESEIRCAFRHQFGDTKHRVVTYTVSATGQFQGDDTVPPSKETVPECNENVGGKPMLCSELNDDATKRSQSIRVLNSTSPSAPGLLYLMPTFRWQRSKVEHESVSKRFGGGIRIWMERGWYSSGDGEKLAVIFVQKPFKSLSSKEAEIATLWGGDPVFAGTAPRDSISLADLRGYEGQPRHGLSIPNDRDVKVSAAVYPVTFDPERRFWRCDVALDANRAYFPMVRLALARYQEHSIRDMELSEVVQAEFIQLTPNRYASVFRSPYNERKVRITVTGFSFDPIAPNVNNGNEALHQSIMELTLEERCEGIVGDEDVWIPARDFRASHGGSDKELPPVVMESKTSGNGVRSWFFEYNLPGHVHRDRYRFVIREFHLFPSALAGDDLQKQCVYADVLGW